MDNVTVEVKSTLPVLNANFEAAKAALSSELQKYESVVVTTETLKDDKKLAQELSAKGKAYNKERIAKVKEVSAPIKVFEDQMKELSSMCASASNLIGEQVKKFEAETLAKIKVMLIDHLYDVRTELKVAEEFFSADISLLVKLGAITKGGSLTKGSKDAVRALVSDELAVQQKVEYRLLQLEAESFKAGLDAPLARINVEQFLHESDEVYAERLAELINVELDRQAQAAKRRAEQEARLEAERQQLPEPSVIETAIIETTTLADPEPVHQEVTLADRMAAVPEYQEPQHDFQQEYQPPQNQAPAKVVIQAHAVFEISVSNAVPDEAIKGKLSDMLKQAGINSLVSMEIKR